jgi:hypothetical protein
MATATEPGVSPLNGVAESHVPPFVTMVKEKTGLVLVMFRFCAAGLVPPGV